jgi:hypothetical protein
MRIYVKPVAGKAVRQPMAPYARIPSEGFYQEDSSAWRRLVTSGDVVITANAPAVRAPAAEPQAADANKSKK